jgi:hypothetical protein
MVNMETSTHEVIETTKRWEELEHREVLAVVAAHIKGLRLHQNTKDKLKRIFDVCRPTVVIGTRDGVYQYCRIHADSVEVTKVAIRTYL